MAGAPSRRRCPHQSRWVRDARGDGPPAALEQVQPGAGPGQPTSGPDVHHTRRPRRIVRAVTEPACPQDQICSLTAESYGAQIPTDPLTCFAKSRRPRPARAIRCCDDPTRTTTPGPGRGPERAVPALPASQSRPVDPVRPAPEIGTPRPPDQPTGQPYPGRPSRISLRRSAVTPASRTTVSRTPASRSTSSRRDRPTPATVRRAGLPGWGLIPSLDPMTRPGSLGRRDHLLRLRRGTGPARPLLASRFAGTITINVTRVTRRPRSSAIIQPGRLRGPPRGGAWLLKDRSTTRGSSPPFASVRAAVTCIGIVATIAVPILAGPPSRRRAWFTPGPTDTGPAAVSERRTTHRLRARSTPHPGTSTARGRPGTRHASTLIHGQRQPVPPHRSAVPAYG